MNVVVVLINMMFCGISFKSQQLLVYYIDNNNLNMLVPTGHTALLERRIKVNDVDSTSEQRRVSSG